MIPKETNAGLLSKMAKFVRNPTKDWSELDAPEAQSDGGYSKAALKEMIERKRQNDFVRRREFDVLRKLRRNEPVAPSDLGSRPSFFHSSLNANHGERAMTIKKIDEIEAQMSKQWWKGKQDGPADAAKPAPVADQANVTTSAPSGAVSTFAPTQADDGGPAFVVPQQDFEPTRTGGEELMANRQHIPVGRASGASDGSVFSSFDLFSVELKDDLADPDLEEAAIRFANGDDAGAEAALLGALQADNVQASMADIWATALFDLYRATGQEFSFDRVAIEYAQRYGRSAPAWFSTPELLGKPNAATPVSPVGSPGQQFAWVCPADLNVDSLVELRAELATAAIPWQFNWGLFSNATDTAADELASLFSQWCDQPVKLKFDGVEAFQTILRAKTPSGDAGVGLCWWQLRLNLMRLMAQQDDFELAALDYCVTYEVSPPPWRTTQCEHVLNRVGLNLGAAEGALPQERRPPSQSSDGNQFPTLSADLYALPNAELELSGEVLGDAMAALGQFEAGAGKGCLVVSCARLIRVDFSAAGSILNWVSGRVADGYEVRFIEVPRLVAAFFNVIGISEHARIILRNR
ncbi:STAS domain-containing protein [Rhodoferax sp. PAMC 29310]|uniref:STAS domain-containing protein n=1 Tax=Rhodoferax sp. PAMC 29310 TaxID=2822760 RepID=UPI001B32F0BC|nr:STAS domain-containing protein [Rhodoferax sp. PAMC 29310]